MIATAEKASNSKQDKVHKRYYNDRSNRDKREKSFSCRRSYSRSRSRSPKSKIREYSGKHSTSIFLSHHAEQKRIYQRPKDDNNPHQSTHRSTSSTKNWKKNKDNETNCKHEKSKPEVKKVDVQQISNIHESDTNKSVTEIDMNKLGAKIIKAELMGDNVRYHCFNVFFSFQILIILYLYRSWQLNLKRNWKMQEKNLPRQTSAMYKKKLLFFQKVYMCVLFIFILHKYVNILSFRCHKTTSIQKSRVAKKEENCGNTCLR